MPSPRPSPRPGPRPSLRQRLPFFVLMGIAGGFAVGVALVVVFAVRDGGPVGPLVSCFDFAEERSGAARSPACAPFILPDGEAVRLLESMTLERLDAGFYLVADEASWAAISKAEVWRTISAVVSAVLAVHGESADVYFIVTPASREESALLLEGKLPAERIVATAIHDAKITRRLVPEDVPEGHFASSYTLSVK